MNSVTQFVKKAVPKLTVQHCFQTNLNPMKKLLLNLMSYLLIQVNWIIPLVRLIFLLSRRKTLVQVLKFSGKEIKTYFMYSLSSNLSICNAFDIWVSTVLIEILRTAAISIYLRPSILLNSNILLHLGGILSTARVIFFLIHVTGGIHKVRFLCYLHKQFCKYQHI